MKIDRLNTLVRNSTVYQTSDVYASNYNQWICMCQGFCTS